MRTPAISCLLLAAACTGGSRPDAAAVGSGDWSLEPVSSFSATLEDSVLVSPIAAIWPGPDGLLYVVMRRQASVTLLHPDGRLARTIGTRGGGPGEFQSPGVIGWRNDSMWVMDPQLQRVSWFGPEGTFLGSEQRPNRHLIPTSAGGYIGMAGTDVDAQSTVVEFQSGAGEPVTTLARLEWSLGGYMLPMGDQGGIVGAHPMKDRPLSALHPVTGELAVVEMAGGTGAVRVSWYSPSGSLSHQESLLVEAPPMDAEAWSAFLTDHFSGPGPAISIPEAMTRIAQPATWLPVTGALMDTRRRIWIRGAANDSTRVRWTIVSPDGTSPASAFLPASLRLLSVRHDTVWTVQPGPDDLDVVTRFLLRGAGPSSRLNPRLGQEHR